MVTLSSPFILFYFTLEPTFAFHINDNVLVSYSMIIMQIKCKLTMK